MTQFAHLEFLNGKGRIALLNSRIIALEVDPDETASAFLKP